MPGNISMQIASFKKTWFQVVNFHDGNEHSDDYIARQWTSEKMSSQNVTFLKNNQFIRKLTDLKYTFNRFFIFHFPFPQIFPAPIESKFIRHFEGN